VQGENTKRGVKGAESVHERKKEAGMSGGRTEQKKNVQGGGEFKGHNVLGDALRREEKGRGPTLAQGIIASVVHRGTRNVKEGLAKLTEGSGVGERQGELQIATTPG